MAQSPALRSHSLTVLPQTPQRTSTDCAPASASSMFTAHPWMSRPAVLA
jgi:hypothetical protein